VVDVLKKGDKGLAVTYWQKALLKRDPGALPVFGADSDFGDETVAATTAFQAGMGIPILGFVDNLTFAYMLNFLAGLNTGISQADFDAEKEKVADLQDSVETLTADLDSETNIANGYRQKLVDAVQSVQNLLNLRVD
jgi:hypothetical protein